MKWLLKNLISSFFLFPVNFLLLMAGAWLLRRKRPVLARRLGVFSFCALWFFSTGAVGFKLAEWVEQQTPALDLNDPNLAQKADAIVVLGAGRTFSATEYGKADVVSSSGVQRLRFAAELEHRVHKPILLSGGEPDRPGKSEAALMAVSLEEDFGIKARWLEEKSVNTLENAEYSYRMLAREKIRRVFLVSHASHMPRAKRAFEVAGFVVVPAPMGFISDAGNIYSPLSWIPGPGGTEMSWVFFHEIIGAAWYWVWGR